MILQRLKLETKSYHDMVEAVAYSDKIMSGRLTLSEYKHLLVSNYQLHRLVEDAIESALSAEELVELDFYERKKTGYLYADLSEMGMLDELSSSWEADFSLRNRAEAIGAMYVLEGSTLGGAIIRRELGKNEEIRAVSSFHYYGCYGAEIGQRWKQFMEVAATLIADDQQEDALQKAKETFELFAQILTQKSPVLAA